jgi:hypothetical protein
MSKPLTIKEQGFEFKNFACGWFEWIVEATCPKCHKKYNTECAGTIEDACHYDYPCSKCEPEQ